jgi:beta-N-acetylhexosaminidase
MYDDLYPYQMLIDNGLASIMAAHVVFSAVDPLPAGFSRKWLQNELRGRMGFTGAIFSDDLNMAGAGIVGDMPERVRAALRAGCDMVPVCNNRQGVLQVIESLQGTEDPVSQVRLARLHGKAAKDRLALRQTDDWQACERSVKACMQRPELKLNA